MSELDFDDGAGRAYDHRLGRRLLAYLRPHRGQVVWAVVVTLAAAAVQLAYPWLTKEAIDLGIRHRDTYVLDRIALAYLSALAIGMGLGYLQTQIMQRVGQSLMVDLRADLFRHLQRLPISYFDRQPIGRVMTRVTMSATPTIAPRKKPPYRPLTNCPQPSQPSASPSNPDSRTSPNPTPRGKANHST